MNRHRIRNALVILMFALLPVIYYYFSPNLVILGAAEGVVAGSLIAYYLAVKKVNKKWK
jgi:hypothetical protein